MTDNWTFWPENPSYDDYGNEVTFQVESDLDDDLGRRTVRLGTSADLAAAMRINRATAAKIVAAGLAGPVFETGRGEHVEWSAINYLASLLPVAAHPPAIVLRVGPPADPDEDFEDTADELARDYTGWGCWTVEMADDLNGVDRWWRLSDPKALLGYAVVVTIGPVVVAVRRLNGLRASVDKFRWFSFGAPDPIATEAFAGRRLDLPAGSAVVLLPEVENEG